jgi:integrase
MIRSLANNIQNNSDLNLEKNIASLLLLLTKESSPYYKSLFIKMSSANIQNAKILSEFLITEHDSQNLKLSTLLSHLHIIHFFSRYLQYRDFEKITKNDIVEYLNSLRKTDLDDPTHKWVGTHNTRQMVLSKFFRWLYNQYKGNESDQKKWITPECMQGLKQFIRKEKSTYKPSDIWTDEDHALFLKYCPEKRDKCYHAMANDTSCRPSELLHLKIKDIKIKTSSTTGMQYAEVHITKSKTKPRTLPLIFSIPYVKDWIDSHPLTNYPDAFLFISLADNNFGKRLSENALYKLYTQRYKRRYFPKLLNEDSSIPEAEKSYIRNLLTKPWTPYIQRHSALTSKSLILKEHTLRDHAGWSMSSKMPQVYIHYFGNESSKSLLEAYGIEDYSNKKDHVNVLRSKSCPNCNEPNKPDSRFCFQCKMVLTFDSYNETLEKEKEKERDIEDLKRSVAFLSDRFNAFLLSQPENKIIYNNDEQIKGIELKPEIKNKAIGKLIPSSTSKNKKN